MKLTMTFGEFYDRFGMSDEACEIMRLNPYCLNEGLATKEDELEINQEQATQLGIHSEEFEARAK